MTKQIGKLKLHVSKRGVAFKWGDGEIHRLAFGASGNGDGYAAAGDPSQDAPGGEPYGQYGYAQYDPEYDRNAQGYSQGYDGYNQQGYDQGYDPGYQGDDYGAQFDQQRYPGDQGYDAEQSGYYEGAPQGGMVEELLYHNDWVMYAALVLLPPLGIWILWKREKFDLVIRAAISAASAIWFVFLLIWLATALFRSPTDPTIPTVNPGGVPTPGPTISATIPDTTGGGVDITTPNTNLLPSNPNANVNSLINGLPGNSTNGGNTAPSGTTPPASTTVYATSGGAFYHKTDTCPVLNGMAASAIDISVARQQNKQPCATCYANGETTPDGQTKTTTYYSTANGKYYHKAATCPATSMKGGKPITKKQAQAKGQTPCPECIGVTYYMTANGDYYHKNSTCPASGMKGGKPTTKKQAQAKGAKPCPKCLKTKSSSSSTITYYATPKGTYYHTKINCGGMKGAAKTTKAEAAKRKQKPCPVCIGTTSSSGTYYATSSGTYYHTKSNCSGMKGAAKVTLTKAKSRGLKACPVCVNKASVATYYATASGEYYHVKSTCSGMKGAKKITLATAKKNGKKPCPTCIGSTPANTYVYMTGSGKYYHSKNNCSGMSGAQKVTLASAKSRGKKACPVCMSTVFYYSTSSNRYYHKNKTCSGMQNATKITLVSAKSKGKTACPICVTHKANANDYKTYCYATTGGRYYHKNKTCQGMKSAKKITLAYAKSIGKKACPVCVLKDSKQGTTQSADAKVKCFLLKKGEYYHSTKSCDKLKGKKGIVTTSVATAKKNKKTPCPDCVGKKMKTYVYVTSTGLLYHKNAHCGGMTGAMKLTLQTALNRAYKRCTKCNAPAP